MKLWRLSIISVPLIALLSISMVSTAHAQDFLAVPTEIANVLVKVGVLMDGMLGHWVSGNELTAYGGTFVNAIAQTVVNTTHFFAELVTLF